MTDEKSLHIEALTADRNEIEAAMGVLRRTRDRQRVQINEAAEQIGKLGESRDDWVNLYGKERKAHWLKTKIAWFQTVVILALVAQAVAPKLQDLWAPAKATHLVDDGTAVGGYKLIQLANGTLYLLKEKGILSEADVTRIVEQAQPNEKSTTAMTMMQFSEALINKLRGEYLDEDQVAKILTTSQNSGGVLVNGYNVMVLIVALLEELHQHGMITTAEGQAVINAARVPMAKAKPKPAEDATARAATDGENAKATP